MVDVQGRLQAKPIPICRSPSNPQDQKGMVAMGIPDYETIMQPLLEFTADQKVHSLREAINAMAERFKLTDEERKQLLSSGQPKLNNRVGWARTYLKKAGLLEPTTRGYFRITHRGLDVLSRNPERIDVEFLEQFPEFLEFKAPSRLGQKDDEQISSKNPQQVPLRNSWMMHTSGCARAWLQNSSAW